MTQPTAGHKPVRICRLSVFTMEDRDLLRNQLSGIARSNGVADDIVKKIKLATTGC